MYFGLMLVTVVVCGSNAMFTPASFHRDSDGDGEISSKLKLLK